MIRKVKIHRFFLSNWLNLHNLTQVFKTKILHSSKNQIFKKLNLAL